MLLKQFFEIQKFIDQLLINHKINFYEIFTTYQAQIGPKIKSTQNFLKFDKLDISDIVVYMLGEQGQSYLFFFNCVLRNQKE